MMENDIKENQASKEEKVSPLLRGIEKIGNKFPSPWLLFVIMIGILLIVAELMKGTPFTFPGVDGEYKIVSLLNKEGLIYIISHLQSNFINFPLIPLIVLFTIAIGVGDKAGFFDALSKRFLQKIPDKLLYFIFFFVAINGNIISDATLLLLPAIGAELFISKGKNPVLAIMITYGGYLAGLSAQIFIAGTDILCTGITQSALIYLPITQNLSIHPASNWFFMAASAFLLAGAGTYAATKFLEPRMNSDASIAYSKEEINSASLAVTDNQKRGLKFALITCIIFIVLVCIMLLPGGWLRDPATDTILPSSPFLNYLTVILAALFFSMGLMYGIGARTIKSSADVAAGMESGMGTIVGLLVVFFFAAQFSDYFSKTNLASYIAIKGANWLQARNFTGVGMLLCIVAFTSIINFFIGTVGNKWTAMAPILVPMLALLGYHPAMAQLVYRIGDSLTNTINPISVYIPVILVYLKKYKKNAGVGTVVSYQIPFFIAFAIVWAVQLVVWFLLKLPLGPLAPIWLS